MNLKQVPPSIWYNIFGVVFLAGAFMQHPGWLLAAMYAFLAADIRELKEDMFKKLGVKDD